MNPERVEPSVHQGQHRSIEPMQAELLLRLVRSPENRVKLFIKSPNYYVERLVKAYLPRLAVLTLILLLILFLHVWAVSWEGSSYGLEVYGTVIKVIDGDTIYVRVLEVYKGRYLYFNGTTIRVRLADINAPELGTPEGEEAKRALTALVYGRSVYLDIDDLYVNDRYGRVVAVVYMPVNSTHLLNINLWLVVNGYAEVRDYQNEFNPSSWNLYIPLAAKNASQVMTMDGKTAEGMINIGVLAVIATVSLLVGLAIWYIVSRKLARG